MYGKKNAGNIPWVGKGWGGEKWIENNELYCGKLLLIMKGKKCSLHHHLKKTETFYVHSGRLEVRYHDSFEETERRIDKYGERGLYDFLEKVILEQGDTFFVPAGRVHQMTALEDVQLFEFSTHHEDSDSYRLLKGD